jgi:uncharacterized protein
MLEIDAPTARGDFENIRWYLSHFDTTVYVERGNHWYLHIQSPCRYLSDDGRCGIYDKRPKICREHDPAACEYDSEYDAKLRFNTLDELDNYIEKRFVKDKKTRKEKSEAAATL